jgi:hypothetical protein
MLIVSRIPVWSLAVPRHHHTHECIAGRFADTFRLGGITWINRSQLGPCEFHVDGRPETFEVTRYACGKNGHRFVVSVLIVTED